MWLPPPGREDGIYKQKCCCRRCYSPNIGKLEHLSIIYKV